MSKHQAAVLIPAYKNKLEWYEKISLEQLLKVFSKKHVFFICPNDTRFEYIPSQKNIKIAYVPQWFMSSIENYNKMLLNEELYRCFTDYEYVLLCQLDVIVTRDLLDRFCELDYDYWGAPWPYLWSTNIIDGKKVHVRVGNGGFSLRRVSSCIRLLQMINGQLSAANQNEDVIFSYYLKKHGFRVAPIKLARLFAGESQISRIYKKNNSVLPFGMHAWHRFSRDFYVKILPKLGINIKDYVFKLQNLDLNGIEHDYGIILSLRLRRRVLGNQDIWKILPARPFWRFHVFGENGLVYYRYLSSSRNISQNKLFYYDDYGTDSLHKLIKNMKSYDGNDIILLDGADIEICSFCSRYGLQEGKDYISLQKAYYRWLKELCGFV